MNQCICIWKQWGISRFIFEGEKMFLVFILTFLIMSPRRQTYLLSLWHAKKQHETSLLWSRLWSRTWSACSSYSKLCTVHLFNCDYVQMCCTSKRRELVEQKPVVASAKYSLNYSRHCWSTIIWTITANGCSQYIHQIWNERKLGTRTQTSSSKLADRNINWKTAEKIQMLSFQLLSTRCSCESHLAADNENQDAC